MLYRIRRPQYNMARGAMDYCRRVRTKVLFLNLLPAPHSLKADYLILIKGGTLILSTSWIFPLPF